MYKILSYTIGNTPETEKNTYDELVQDLNRLEKQGYKVVSSSWDTGGPEGGAQNSGLVLILHKKRGLFF